MCCSKYLSSVVSIFHMVDHQGLSHIRKQQYQASSHVASDIECRRHVAEKAMQATLHDRTIGNHHSSSYSSHRSQLRSCTLLYCIAHSSSHVSQILFLRSEGYVLPAAGTGYADGSNLPDCHMQNPVNEARMSIYLRAAALACIGTSVDESMCECWEDVPWSVKC